MKLVDLPADYFDEVKAEYCKRRDVLVARLNKIEGVHCPNPGGAFYAMAKLPSEKFKIFANGYYKIFHSIIKP